MPAPALTQLSFKKAAEAWLESRRSYLAAKTYREYRLSLRTLSKFFGELRLPEIDGDLVRRYQRMRTARIGDGAFAVNHECGLLVMMRKRIGLPLTDYQPLPLPKTERGRALSDEQRTRLLRIAHANPHWEAAYLFALISVNTSAGPKETATLRLKDVDLDKATIRIQPGGAKNVHRIRTIPLNDEAMLGLKLAISRAKGLGARAPEDYLFPFRVSTGRYDPARHQTTFKTAWKKLIAAAELPGFRPYDLRHHAITALLENPEVSEETAEDIAGHISRRMKKRYSHIRMKYKRAAVEAISPKKGSAQPRRAKAARPKEGERDELLSEFALLLRKLLKSG